MPQLIDPFHEQVTDEKAKENINNNIIMATALLDTCVETTLEHIRKTQAQCVRACVGNEIGYLTEDMIRTAPKALVATLQLAIRRLAELDYEKELLA